MGLCHSSSVDGASSASNQAKQDSAAPEYGHQPETANTNAPATHDTPPAAGTVVDSGAPAASNQASKQEEPTTGAAASELDKGAYASQDDVKLAVNQPAADSAYAGAADLDDATKKEISPSAYGVYQPLFEQNPKAKNPITEPKTWKTNGCVCSFCQTLESEQKAMSTAASSPYGVYAASTAYDAPVVVGDIKAQATASNYNTEADLDVKPLMQVDDLVAVEKDMAVNTSKFRDWNAEYQVLLERPCATPEQHQQRLDLIDRFVREFLEFAEPFARTIILEEHLPLDAKTIPPVNVGGVAGGEKFCTSGLFLKFTRDFNGLYKSEEAPQKVASHELRSLGMIASCGIPSLHIPIFGVVKWLGRCVCVTCALPLSRESLMYGTADAGVTVHNDDERLNQMMSQLGNALNLAPHLAGQTEPKVVYTAADLEGHLGQDGRYYCLDTARLFPPCSLKPPAQLLAVSRGVTVPINVIAEAVPDSPRMNHLFWLMRPELVRAHSTALSSDAYSGFSAVDPAARTHIRDVDSATSTLLAHTIPSVAEALLSPADIPAAAAADDKEDDQQKAAPLQNVDFLEHTNSQLHEAGINLRYLGTVRACVNWFASHTHSHVQSTSAGLLLVEMVARVMSKAINAVWRHALSSGRLAEFLKSDSDVTAPQHAGRLVVEVLRETAHSSFWSAADASSFVDAAHSTHLQAPLKVLLQRKYGRGSLSEAEWAADLRAVASGFSVHLWVNRLLQLIGVVMDAGSMQQCVSAIESSQSNDDSVWSGITVSEVKAKTKSMQMKPFAQALQSDQEFLAAVRVYEDQIQQRTKVLGAKSLGVVEVYLNLGDVLTARGVQYYSRAQQCYRTALDTCTAMDNQTSTPKVPATPARKLRVRALHQLGQCHRQFNVRAEGLKCFERADKLLQECDDFRQNPVVFSSWLSLKEHWAHTLIEHGKSKLSRPHLEELLEECDADRIRQAVTAAAQDKQDDVADAAHVGVLQTELDAVLARAQAVRAHCMVFLGQFADKRNESEKAMELYQSALELLDQSHRGADVFKGHAANNQDDVTEQKAKHRKLAEFASLKFERATVATCYNIIGGFFLKKLQLGQAEELFCKALKMQDALTGQNHPDRAQTLNNLGLLHVLKGDADWKSSAEEAFERALAVFNAKLGAQHTYARQARHNLDDLRSGSLKPPSHKPNLSVDTTGQGAGDENESLTPVGAGLDRMITATSEASPGGLDERLTRMASIMAFDRRIVDDSSSDEPATPQSWGRRAILDESESDHE